MNSINLTLKLKLKTKKKLLVSSRAVELDPALDVPFVRLGEGEHTVPYMPGSTVKGVLRTTLIRIVDLLGHRVSVKSVEPSILAKTKSTNEVVISLFGAPQGPKGKLVFFPTVLDENPYRLTHVKIDDETKTAEHGGLYTAEYIPVGYDFVIDVKAVDLSFEEAEALFAAIAAMPYERIGKAGLVDVRIDTDGSKIPKELLDKSLIIREVIEVMKA